MGLGLILRLPSTDAGYKDIKRVCHFQHVTSNHAFDVNYSTIIMQASLIKDNKQAKPIKTF